VVNLTAPSKLETHAITSHAPQARSQPPSEAFRTAQKQRQKLLQRLEDEDALDLWTPLSKCGETISLYCTCCGTRNDFSKRCNHKWCPVCQRALAARASLRYEGICGSMAWPLFSTFTEKNHPDDGTDFIRALRRSFGKLRRLRWWLKCVKGGVAAIEVTNTGNGWHPHLHAIIDCRWLSVNQLPPARDASSEKKKRIYTRANKEVCEQWSLCTGRPSSVKTKRAYARPGDKSKSIAMEIIKYSVKGSDLVDYKGDIAPILRMLDGTRLLTSWGSCYGHIREHDMVKQPTRCESCGIAPKWMPTSELDFALRSSKRRK
jgi:hypothetical protein